MRHTRIAAALALASLLFAPNVFAQGAGQRGAQGQAPQTPRAIAPTDFTGYWVAVVTEDWRWRMMTAPVGDTASLPMNPEGLRVAKEWDINKDVAAGEQCKPFGAAGIMRMPVRLHVTWQDDATLKMEIDNGTQTRLFHFDPKTPAPAAPDWQGLSLARWETNQEGEDQPPFTQGQAGGQNALGQGLTGSLRVMTTNMRPGYLRRNGVPYSGNARMTEYLDRTNEANGDSWLTVLSVIDDPQYLTMPLVLTTHFKHEANGTKFQPRPCELTPPVPAPPPSVR